MSHLAHIADRVLNRPLLILPEKAAVILSVLAGRIGIDAPEASRFEGDRPPQRDAEGNVKRNMFGDPIGEPFKLAGSTAIVSVVGSLVNRGAWVGASSGLTSYEGVQYQLKRAAAHADVRSILLDLHSPGGEAIGAFETAALVRAIAVEKPVTAVVNGMAASAAYAIASGATDIVSTETGLSGSIGVVLLHADYSRQLANEGVSPTLIFAGAHKVDGNPFAPLSDTVKADIQAEVDAFYEAFLRTVAQGRGDRLSADAARATEARTFVGAAALAAGLADRIGTFESALADLGRAATRAGGRNPSSNRRNSMDENSGAPAAQTTAGITQADLEAAVNDAVSRVQAESDKRVAAERARMAGLDELSTLAGAGAATIIAAARQDGSSVEATALAILKAKAHLPAAALAGIEQDARATAAVAPAPMPAAAAAVPQTPDGWKAEWQASDRLQAEFISAELYVAHKKDEQRRKEASK